MPKPQPAPWLDNEGQIITIADVIDALSTGASLVLRESKTSTQIENNPGMEAEYQRKHLIINKVITAYKMSVVITKEPTKQIPSKKKKKVILSH